MKNLIIDIETSPSLVYVWKQFQNDVALNQIEGLTEVMCFAAKWQGEKRVMFYSTHHHGKDAMVQRAWELLDEADVVTHFNGRSFDVKHLNREFVLAGMTPPSPYKQVDLLLVARKNFRFFSNKLAHITEQLGLSGKLSHTGFDMWRQAMAGDEKAWSLFKRYNIQDVRTTEELYDRLVPWLGNTVNVALLDGIEGKACPRCKSADLERRGIAYTAQSAFQKYHCKSCGAWPRGTKALGRAELTGAS